MPSATTAERYEYLDELKESGVTNMLGAGPYLEAKFGMDRNEAREVLHAWIGGDARRRYKSYASHHPKGKDSG